MRRLTQQKGTDSDGSMKDAVRRGKRHLFTENNMTDNGCWVLFPPKQTKIKSEAREFLLYHQASEY